jgi:hypothetical protein
MKGGDCTKDFQKKKSQIPLNLQKYQFYPKKVSFIFQLKIILVFFDQKNSCPHPFTQNFSEKYLMQDRKPQKYCLLYFINRKIYN